MDVILTGQVYSDLFKCRWKRCWVSKIAERVRGIDIRLARRSFQAKEVSKKADSSCMSQSSVTHRVGSSSGILTVQDQAKRVLLFRLLSAYCHSKPAIPSVTASVLPLYLIYHLLIRNWSMTATLPYNERVRSIFLLFRLVELKQLYAARLGRHHSCCSRGSLECYGSHTIQSRMCVRYSVSLRYTTHAALIDRHAMDAFRYILTHEEKSLRAIELTETILKQNPGMFTVWNYRSMLLTSAGLDVDLNKELDLMEALIKVHLKGYQVWFVSPMFQKVKISSNQCYGLGNIVNS